MLLKSLHLQDFLSFGRNCMPVELGPLNVVIGANGSGKSNFVEAIDLMRAAPCASESSNAGSTVRDGGGAGEWIWKGAKEDSGACIEAVIDHPGRETDLRYMMRFADGGENGFEIREECVEEAVPSDRRNDPHFFYRRVVGKSLLGGKREAPRIRERGHRSRNDDSRPLQGPRPLSRNRLARGRVREDADLQVYFAPGPEHH